MKVKRAWLGLAIIATLLIFSVLTLVAWDVVREVIVVPIAYLIWLGGLVLRNIPQEIYLVLLIVIAFFIALNTLNRLQIRSPRNRPVWDVPVDTSRYRFWLRMCKASYSSDYARAELAREARKLILSILSYQEGLPPPEVEQKIANGDWPAPPAVRKLMRERELASTPQPQPPLWRRLLRKPQQQIDPLLDQSLEEIVHFLETRLEIVHDGNSLSSQE